MGAAITYVDLFSGTGGFALGLLQAGFTFKQHYFSENDRSAIANYKFHFPKAKPLGSIEKVSPSKIKEKIDLLTFGFPCQDLSLAGKRKGLKGKKSRLFYEALRLIKSWQPRVFIFENVKGLFSADKGRAFETILKEIAGLGLYECQWQLCDTAWFLPQHRERIYFVATARKETVPQIFPIPESCKRDHPRHVKTTQTKIAPSIDTRVGNGGSWSPYVVNKWHPLKTGRNEKAKRIRRLNQSKNGIDSCPFGEKSYRISKDQAMGTITTGFSKDNLLAGYFQYDPSGKGHNSQHARIFSTKGNAPTLSHGRFDVKVLDQMQIRRLTPVECERLQGFPDHWTQTGFFDLEKQEISDTQRYKLLGNAVSVPVVKAVGGQLKKHFFSKQ